MIRPLAVIPAALWASAAAASFHPVEDRAYRYDMVETRDADGVVLRFHASRSVLFHRTDTGYDATVTLDALDSQAGGDIGAMFLATTGAWLRRPLRYRLDAAGSIVDVEAVDATIALVADAVERSSRNRARSGDLARFASPLRTLPPERKRAMLVSVLAPLIAGTAADQPAGERAVTLPSRPPLPPGTALTGTERVSRGGAGLVTVRTEARGGVDSATLRDTHGADTARPGTAAATVETVRNVDPASGLVIDSRAITESILSDGEAIHRSRSETVVTLCLTK